MVGQVAQTQCELPTCEEIDTAAYAAKFCRLQTILPHYPDWGKRNKQAENAVRLSMSDSEVESMVGTCLMSCVQGKQGRESRVAVSHIQSIAEPRGVEGVTTPCMRSPRSCQNHLPCGRCRQHDTTPAVQLTRREVRSHIAPSQKFRLLSGSRTIRMKWRTALKQ